MRKVHEQEHYFEKLMGLMPFSHFWRAVFVSVLSLLLFFLLSVPNTTEVLRTNIFLLQLNFSITIFIGIWLGGIAAMDFRLIFFQLRKAFGYRRAKRNQLEEGATRLWVSWRAQLFAIPFMISGLAIAFFNADEMQAFLGQSGFSPLYIYLVIFRACILVTNLLGATAYWIMYCLTILFREYSKSTKVNSCLSDLTELKKIEATIRKLSFFLLVIILSLVPAILVIASHLPEEPRRFLTNMGAILPMAVLLLSFFFPTWFLNQLIRKTRECRESILEKQIYFLETWLFSSTKPDASTLKRGRYLTSLAACREEMKHLKQEATSSFSATVLLELLLAGLVSPVATLIFQRIVI